MSLNLAKGSLAGRVEANKKEFREFAQFIQQFMTVTQQRFRDVQGAFAEALLNHENRLIALEKALAVTPNQVLKDELENLIIESAEISNQMEAQKAKDDEPELPGMPEPVAEEPVKQESKVKFHKNFD
jgi:hypothetical protein